MQVLDLAGVARPDDQAKVIEVLLLSVVVKARQSANLLVILIMEAPLYNFVDEIHHAFIVLLL